MAKRTKQKIIPFVTGFDAIHMSLEGLSGKEIMMKTDREHYVACTCTRCDKPYAYSGKNPQYCPSCLSYQKTRGKI